MGDEQVTMASSESHSDGLEPDSKFLMANAAHDLKTPLASFNMGIEAIRHLITDAENRVRNHPKAGRLVNYISELYDQLNKMELQSCLMSMAINCCMDYTKVTSGTSLTCQMDTVDIRSCLDNVSALAPLMFGSKLQSLGMEPLSDAVCPFVITDGRWLQENVLSLLEQCLREANEAPLSISIRVHLEYPQQALPIVEKESSSTKEQGNSESQTANESIKPPALMIPRRPSEPSLKEASPTHLISPRANRVRLSIGSVKSEKGDDSLIETLAPSEGGTTPVASYRPESAQPHPAAILANSVSRDSISFVNRFQVRMLVVEIHRTASVPSATVHTTATDERMFLHGKSSADMAAVNMKARLKFLHGQCCLPEGPDDTKQTMLASLAIPYRPDLNRNLSFMGQSFCLPSSSFMASSDTLGRGPEATVGECAKEPSLLVPGQSSSSDSTDTRASVFQSCSTLTTPRFETQSSYLASMPTTARTVYSESAAGSLESDITGQPVTTSSKVVFNPLYSLQCSSEGGTTVSLPRNSISHAATSHAWSTTESFVKPPIILVDDSSMVLKLTRTVLERSGYKVQIARNGLEAVQAVSEHLSSCGGPAGQMLRSRELWPVVLMDLQMPVLDGIEAVKRIRAVERESLPTEHAPRLVVLALSVSNGDPVVAEALSAGCDAFLQKPFNLEDFEAVVTRLRDILSLRV